MRARYFVVPREVVRVPYPAVAVRVLLVTAGEVRGSPAGHRFADDVAQAESKGQDDKDNDTVATAHAVGEVVVFIPLRLR